jgi:hypothetical protein
MITVMGVAASGNPLDGGGLVGNVLLLALPPGVEMRSVTVATTGWFGRLAVPSTKDVASADRVAD